MARTHILKGFTDVDAALWVLSQTTDATITDLVDIAQSAGLRVTDSVRFEAVQVLTELGIASKESRSLSARGVEFYKLWQIRRSDAIDVLHGLQYGLWKPSEPSENIASWAYRTICDYLWDRQTIPEKDSLTRYVFSQRSATESIPSDLGDAFSTKSIADAYDWLLPLDPPVFGGVIEGEVTRSFRQATFQRRPYCSTPLFLMAIDHLMGEMRQSYGDLIMIDTENQRRLCSFCLLEESAIEIMFDDALRRFSDLLSYQREWGVFVTLTRQPQIEDFV